MAEGPTLASLDAGKMTAADEMRAIMAEAGGIDAGSNETPVSPAPEAPVSPEPEPGKQAADDGDNVDRGDGRNSKGRWVGKGQDPALKAAKPPTEPKAAPKAEDGKEPAEAAPEEPDDLDPPHDRDLAWQTEFRKLPPALKQFVLDADKTSREVTAERARYQNLDSMFAPRRQSWAMSGITDDAAAIKALLAYSDYADQHPAEFIQQLMQAKGLTFEQQPAQQQQPGADDYDDPALKAVRDELNATRNEFNQIKQGLQAQTQAQRQHEISEARNALVAFQNEKDERGRPKHPYMSDPNIRSLMSTMLRSGRAPDHVKAYEMACHADPDVRAKIAAAAKADEERARAAELRKKADAAQRAGSSISGSPAGPAIGPDLSGKSAREDLRQVAAEMGFRF